MSRRHSAEKREVLPDPKFGNIIITKFMNSVMYAGKKSVAEGIVYGALGMIETKTKLSPLPIFDRRHHVFQRLLENRQRALLGLGLDHAERTVDDAFGDRLLPGVHHRVHEFRNDDVSELRIRKHFTLFSRMAARHLLFSFVMAGLVPAIRVLTC